VVHLVAFVNIGDPQGGSIHTGRGGGGGGGGRAGLQSRRARPVVHLCAWWVALHSGQSRPQATDVLLVAEVHCAGQGLLLTLWPGIPMHLRLGCVIRMSECRARACHPRVGTEPYAVYDAS
jgi:hypothetical protein